MIDIHSHLLYGVDDGARFIEVSQEMLDDAANQGITDIILTPHYREGMFPYRRENIGPYFDTIKGYAAQRGIRLYLGCEYHANSEMIENIQTGRVETLAGTDYVLTEFSYSSAYGKVRNAIEELLSNGYIPVIAHAERYEVFEKDVELLDQFREMGVLVQLNANSILGIDGRAIKRICRKILKKGLADIVASDSHDMSERRINMKECMKYVSGKYGEDTAQMLFEYNPGKIIEKAQRNT